ncbi:MAG: PD-(D/E)XK nuclease family protein, partial [Patescibacteria group bacterium]|nr:PD-(D/E)XK nuclease family protein [Patescibacteria group bacterium]
LMKWSKNLEFYNSKHNIFYSGKIDDLLIDKNGSLVPLDFKTTLSEEFYVYESYKRQLEIYGYFLRKQSEVVSEVGVFYVVKIKIGENFEKKETREIVIQENLNYDVYDEILENLKEVYFSSIEPSPGKNCSFCLRDFQLNELIKSKSRS